MSSSLRRMNPRFLTSGWTSLRPSQQPQRFLRSQYAPTLLRRDVISGRDLISPLSKTQLRILSTGVSQSAQSLGPARATLPTCCPGCGAYAQTIEPNEPGYYGKTRKQTRKHLSEAQTQSSDESARQEVAAAVNQVFEGTEIAPKPARGILLENAADTIGHYLEKSKFPVQVCDRCHDLLHHNKAAPIISPTIHSVGAYLDESPHKANRIYHVIDAADFPMSLVDGIYKELSIQQQRSRNRRSPTEKYKSGRKLPTISFVITRSDLLAPTKELVDSKMEYVRSILREKLNVSAEEFRMGNVHMISAHRGWWTKKVKEEMREHGGGIWIVGKINAGKSSFVEACLPKDSRNLEKMAELVARRNEAPDTPSLYDHFEENSDSILPPAPKEDLYPVLPVVSSLPGTTASPIRIPFGRGKGEIIDLPGLDRGNLADYVLDQHKRDLIMTQRKKPQRYTMKPGRSLLLGGGLVRITPLDPETIVMAACFLPIEAHLTKTGKAVEMQAQGRPYPGTNIVKESTGTTISSAGIFDLEWDVTRTHLPRSIAKAVEDKGIKPPSLPYRVMSADILVEGCGWVELTAQVRAKPDADAPERSFPKVQVFTPGGKHIASRQPIECWQFTEKKTASDRRKHGGRRRQNIGQLKRIRKSKQVSE